VGLVREQLDEVGALAYTERMGPGFLIHVDPDLHGELLVHVLEHEWAHTMHYPDYATCSAEAHGDVWGVDLARAYRAGTLDSD